MSKFEENKAEHRKDPNWKGYTLEELMYQRAYTAARIEIQKQRLVTNYNELSNAHSSVSGFSLVRRLTSGFSYFDIAVYAFKIGRGIFRGIRRLRR